MPVDAVRDAALDVILRVFEKGTFLDASLDKTLRRKRVSERGRRFLTQLAYGTVRHAVLCDSILEKLAHQPLAKLPPSILAVLRMGVFQALFCDQVTFPAMVHTSVDLAKKRGHAGTARLVNAVLRRAPASLDDVQLPDPKKEPAEYLRVRFSLPKWLVEKWTSQYGHERTEELCAALNLPAPTAVRANTNRVTVAKLREALEKAGCVVEKRTETPEELTILSGPPPTRTWAFREGMFLIQDPASMLPPHLVEPKPGDRVLDLCAAPGGKTTHLAALAEDKAEIVALDLHRWRLGRVQENVVRLGSQSVFPVCGDGERSPFKPEFDRVLLDAPCSGLGTLRRNPDLKRRIEPNDVERLAELQRTLLRSAVRLCKNAGVIVYSVCTMTREETEDVVEQILDEGAVEPEDGPEWLNQWKKATGRYETLPSRDGLDGFYLTRLRKLS